MLFFGNIPIVLIDPLELRGIALANFFASLLSEKKVILLHCPSTKTIESTWKSDEFQHQETPMFILNVEGLDLADPALGRDILTLRKMFPGCLVLVMMEDDWNGEIASAMSLAINGVVTLSMHPRVFVSAIEIVLLGGAYFPTLCPRETAASDTVQLSAKVPERAERPVPPAGEGTLAKANRASAKAITDKIQSSDAAGPVGSDQIDLSRRQIDVLKTLQVGMSNKEIARALGLSDATVKIHVRHLMRKFGVVNRTQVALLSKNNGTLEQEANRIVGQTRSL